MNASWAGDLDADGLGELTALELGGGEEGVEGVVGDDAAIFLRPEEESFVFHNGAGEGVASVVPTQGWTADVAQVVEEVISGVSVVAIEPVDAAVELVGTGAGDDVDLAGSAAAELGRVSAAVGLELGDGVDAGEGQQGEVGAAIEIVGAVDHVGAAGGAATVEREGDDVGAAVGILEADVEFVGGGGGRDAGQELEQLDVVAIVEGELADFLAGDEAFGGGVLELDLGGVGFDGDLLGQIADFKLDLKGEFFGDVEFNAGLGVALEAGSFDFDGVEADGEESGDTGAV